MTLAVNHDMTLQLLARICADIVDEYPLDHEITLHVDVYTAHGLMEELNLPFPFRFHRNKLVATTLEVFDLNTGDKDEVEYIFHPDQINEVWASDANGNWWNPEFNEWWGTHQKPLSAVPEAMMHRL
jgi:hypothetical protein